MAYDRQRVVVFLRRLGYTQAADEAARVPDPVSLDQFWELAGKCGITGDVLNSRMGGGP